MTVVLGEPSRVEAEREVSATMLLGGPTKCVLKYSVSYINDLHQCVSSDLLSFWLPSECSIVGTSLASALLGAHVDSDSRVEGDP